MDLHNWATGLSIKGSRPWLICDYLLKVPDEAENQGLTKLLEYLCSPEPWHTQQANGEATKTKRTKRSATRYPVTRAGSDVEVAGAVVRTEGVQLPGLGQASWIGAGFLDWGRLPGLGQASWIGQNVSLVEPVPRIK